MKEQQESTSATIIFFTISTLLIILAVWRLPADNMRLYIELCFEVMVILLLVTVMSTNANKWVGLFFLCSFLNLCYFYFIYRRAPILLDRMNIIFFNIFCGLLFYFLLVNFLYYNEKNRKIILDIFCIIALANVTMLILQYFNLDAFHLSRVNIGKSAIVGLMTSRNEAAALLALCCPSFFRKRRWILLPLVFIGVCITGCLLGVVVIIMEVIGFLLMSMNKSILRKNKIYALIGLLLICLSCFGFIKFFDLNTRDAVIVRWQVNKIAFSFIKKKVLSGYGLGIWEKVTEQATAFKNIDKVWWRTANNEYIQIFFEGGIFCVLIIVGYLCSIVKRIRLRDVKKNRIELSMLIGVLTCCSIHYVFHNGVEAAMALMIMAIVEIVLRKGQIVEWQTQTMEAGKQ